MSKYKIQTLNGFKMYFDQIINVFKTRYEIDENFDLDKLSEMSGLNRRKARLILNFLADIGLSQKGSLKKTQLGSIIHKYDDFLEKPATLWLMHYLQGSNNYIITWNRVLNYLYDKETITRGELVKLFSDLEGQIGEYAYNHHIGKEIRIILDAYTNQKFSDLYILEDYDGVYNINRNSEIPETIFLAAVKKYQEINYPGATAVDVSEIVTAINSPGRLFLLDDHIVREKLEILKNKGYIGLESRGDLDQVRLKDDISFEEIVEMYYKE